MEFNFKNVVKNTALLFAIGVAVSYAAPVVIGMLTGAGIGVGATVASHAATAPAGALWLGVVFGAFGGLHVAMAPMFDKLFGKDEAPQAQEKHEPHHGHGHHHAHGHGHQHGLHINNVQVAADVDMAKAANFAQQIDQERNTKTDITAARNA